MMTQMPHWLRRHRAACFVLMTLSFLLFGALSLDLVRLLALNWDLLWTHSWQAVMDGGLQQLAELLLKALAANAAYLVFKWCEHVLVHPLESESPALCARTASRPADGPG